MTPCFAAALAFANFLDVILEDWPASFPDESFRLAVENFVEGIFFLAVENLLEGIFVMTVFL